MHRQREETLRRRDAPQRFDRRQALQQAMHQSPAQERRAAIIAERRACRRLLSLRLRGRERPWRCRLGRRRQRAPIRQQRLRSRLDLCALGALRLALLLMPQTQPVAIPSRQAGKLFFREGERHRAGIAQASADQRMPDCLAAASVSSASRRYRADPRRASSRHRASGDIPDRACVRAASSAAWAARGGASRATIHSGSVIPGAPLAALPKDRRRLHRHLQRVGQEDDRRFETLGAMHGENAHLVARALVEIALDLDRAGRRASAGNPAASGTCDALVSEREPRGTRRADRRLRARAGRASRVRPPRAPSTSAKSS